MFVEDAAPEVVVAGVVAAAGPCNVCAADAPAVVVAGAADVVAAAVAVLGDSVLSPVLVGVCGGRCCTVAM